MPGSQRDEYDAQVAAAQKAFFGAKARYQIATRAFFERPTMVAQEA